MTSDSPYLERCRKIAGLKGGKLLSEEYLGSKEPLDIECSKGHHFSATYNSIVSGRWCPQCAGNKKKTIEDIRIFSESLNGVLLSTSYVNSKTPLRWQCGSCESVFMATYSNVSQGRWCPYCKASKGEEFVRGVFEEYFEKKFPRARPSWLRGRHKRLELDGFCKWLGVAFEYHGIQHYTVNFLNKTKEKLRKRQLYDRYKLHKCAKLGIKLFVFDGRNPHTKESIIATIKSAGY